MKSVMTPLRQKSVVSLTDRGFQRMSGLRGGGKGYFFCF